MADKSSRIQRALLRFLLRITVIPALLWVFLILSDNDSGPEVFIPAIWAVGLALGLLATHAVQFAFELVRRGFRRYVRLVEGAQLAGIGESLVMGMVNSISRVVVDVGGYYWTLAAAMALGGIIGYAVVMHRWGLHTSAPRERKGSDAHPARGDGSRCELCKGSGVCVSCRGTGVDQSKAPCSQCHGTVSCPTCGGMGHTRWNKRRGIPSFVKGARGGGGGACAPSSVAPSAIISKKRRKVNLGTAGNGIGKNTS